MSGSRKCFISLNPPYPEPWKTSWLFCCSASIHYPGCSFCRISAIWSLIFWYAEFNAAILEWKFLRRAFELRRPRRRFRARGIEFSARPSCVSRPAVGTGGHSKNYGRARPEIAHHNFVAAAHADVPHHNHYGGHIVQKTTGPPAAAAGGEGQKTASIARQRAGSDA